MIGIVHYGCGNLQAISNIYERLGVPSRWVENPSDLEGVERLVLPGVGAFDWAMDALNDSGLRDALDRWALRDRRPLLGICVGMQLLGLSSDEGPAEGLGWVPGRIRHFSAMGDQAPDQMPHMGWNEVDARPGSPLFEGTDMVQGFYFLHSYFFECSDPTHELASTRYGASFTSAVQNGNVFGVQFHPEKSHGSGVRLLKNFALSEI